jgi:hypothetical protein
MERRVLAQARKLLHKVLLGGLDLVFQRLDCLVSNSQAPPQWPPIFIIGAPRTGSTIFYQAFTKRFRVCYINNFMHRFIASPSWASYLSRLLFGWRGHNRFDSVAGSTKGLNSPSESGNFWYRWFPKDPVYTPAGTVSSKDLAELRANVAGIIRAWGLPIVFKNLYCSMRLGPLSEVFPDAMFIHCTRDPFYCANSLLMGRLRVLGDMSEWWSLKPKEYDEIKNHHYCQQVVEQQYYIQKQIQEDMKLFGEDKMLTVEYGEFCNEPEKVLDRVRKWLAASGIVLRHRAKVAGKFHEAIRIGLVPEEVERLKVAIKTFFPSWNEHGLGV